MSWGRPCRAGLTPKTNVRTMTDTPFGSHMQTYGAIFTVGSITAQLSIVPDDPGGSTTVRAYKARH